MVEKRRAGVTYWIRDQKFQGCKSRVPERGDVFTPGNVLHICQPKAGATILAKIRAGVNKTAKAQPFTSAKEIVDKVSTIITGGFNQ